MSRPDHEDARIADLMRAPLAEQAHTLSTIGMEATGLLILMSPCEQRCRFCAQPAVTHPPRSDWTPKNQIEAFLVDNTTVGLKRLCIGGTEPPTHPDFEWALQRAAEVGFDHIELMTSATRLATPGLAERWRAAGIRTIAAPIYSRHKSVHDDITGGAHHDRLLRGLDAAHAVGITVRLHTLALKQTLDEIPELARMCARRWGAALTVAPARPKRGVWDFDLEAPSLIEVDKALMMADPTSLRLTGWPACLLTDLERGAAQVISLYFMGQTRRFGAACSGCAIQGNCPGVVANLLNRDGAAGLRPQ